MSRPVRSAWPPARSSMSRRLAARLLQNAGSSHGAGLFLCALDAAAPRSARLDGANPTIPQRCVQPLFGSAQGRRRGPNHLQSPSHGRYAKDPHSRNDEDRWPKTEEAIETSNRTPQCCALGQSVLQLHQLVGSEPAADNDRRSKNQHEAAKRARSFLQRQVVYRIGRGLWICSAETPKLEGASAE